jgi:hypothetical protein
MRALMGFMKSGGTLFPTRAHPALIPGLQDHSDVKSQVFALVGSPDS